MASRRDEAARASTKARPRKASPKRARSRTKKAPSKKAGPKQAQSKKTHSKKTRAKKARKRTRPQASASARLIRLLALSRHLASKKRGATVAGLQEAFGVCRSTIYRDLDALQAAGLPLVRERVVGESRARIDDEALSKCAWSREELLALSLARAALQPLAGTKLDRLLESIGASATGQPSVGVVYRAPPVDPVVNAALEQALHGKRRLCILYRSSQEDTASERRVDPLGLRLSDGALYLDARLTDGTDEDRTYKVARIERADVLDEPATATGYDPASLHAHAVGVWAGEPVDVAIAIDAAVARFVHEWPLTDVQSVEERADGSAVLRATVAGELEVMRWALRWGAGVQVLAPPSLRDRVARELSAALSRYTSDSESLSRAVGTGAA